MTRHAIIAGTSSPAQYSSTTFTPLDGVTNDVETMESLTKECGFNSVESEDNADRDWVVNQLRTSSNQLCAEDTLVFFFAGHGFQIPRRGEADSKVEALALRDGFLEDSEITRLLSGFDELVDVIAIFDACHAGGMIGPGAPKSSIDLEEYEKKKKEAKAHKIARKPHLPPRAPTMLTIGASHESAKAAEDSNASGEAFGLLTRSIGLFAPSSSSWQDLWNNISIDAQTHPAYQFAPSAALNGPSNRRLGMLKKSAFF